MLWHQLSWNPFCIQFAHPKISVKTMWTKPELMHMDLPICLTLRCLSSKTIQWMASTCLSIGNVFGDLTKGHLLAIPVLCEFYSPLLHCCIKSGVFSKWSIHVFIDFLGVRSYLSFVDTLWLCSVLSIVKFVSHILLFMGLTCTKIKTET